MLGDLRRLVRRFGVLPLSQAIVLTLSTVTFAWLARQLGPDIYARFAVIMLFFSAISLLTDLSPQGFLLVRGLAGTTRTVAKKVALMSACAGFILLFAALLFAGGMIPLQFPDLVEIGLLCGTLALQVFTQVGRAELVISSQYKTMAVIDISSTVVGCAVSVVVALSPLSRYSLVMQLAITVCGKYAATTLAPRGGTKTREFEVAGGPSLIEAVRFGFRVIPLNLASYLSRALDSGLLPSLVSPAAAAGYARGYQVVVVPISQLQLSLGSVVIAKLSNARNANTRQSDKVAKKLWTWLQRISLFAGIAIILTSGLIQFILFGPKWPMVNVTLSAMATCLPGVAAAAYGAWATQVDGGKVRTLSHFLAVLFTPICVVVVAASFGFAPALLCLVIVGGLIQPSSLAIVHRKSIPIPLRIILIGNVFKWLLVAALFLAVASISGFWSNPLG